MGYTKQAIIGLGWAGGLRVTTRAFSFIRTVVLARLLSPIQFGVFGIAILATSLLETFTETGINVILVQEKNDIGRYLNSAWIVSIVRGTFISLIVFLSASFVSKFFRSHESLFLLQVISIVPFLRGFINSAVVKFQKNLEFNKEFWYRSVIFVFESIISIILAFITRNATSLVFGLIAGVLFEVFLSFLIIKPIPKLQFEKDYFLKVFHRGKWVTLSGVFNYLYHNVDNIVVGRLLGVYTLGLYEMAYKISMLPITEISDVVSRVTFPVYTIISDDTARLKKAFLKTTFFITFIAVPFGFILFLFSDEIVKVLLGKTWTGIIPVLKILVVFGVIRAISGSTSALFLAVKKQRYITIVTLVSIFSLAIFIIPLVLKFGIIGAGISALIGSIASIPFMIYFTVKVLYEKSES